MQMDVVIKMEDDRFLPPPAFVPNNNENEDEIVVSVPSTPSVSTSKIYEFLEPEEDEPVTPDYGSYYEEYINSLLTMPPLSLYDDVETPENSVHISFSSNKSNVRRSLFRQ